MGVGDVYTIASSIDGNWLAWSVTYYFWDVIGLGFLVFVFGLIIGLTVQYFRLYKKVKNNGSIKKGVKQKVKQIPNLPKEQKAILLIIAQHGEIWANDFMDSTASALAVNGYIYPSGKGDLYKGTHYVILNEMRNAILKDRRAMAALNDAAKSIDEKWGYIITTEE